MTISNIFIGSDGNLRIQLQLKSATIKDIKEGVDLDQSESFSKYGEEIDFSSFKLPNNVASSSSIDNEEIENLDEILANS